MPLTPRERAQRDNMKRRQAADNLSHELECVRCGAVVSSAGNRPWKDANGVGWVKCPEGCAPPGNWSYRFESAACVPVPVGLREESVFDPADLDPDDALYDQ